MKIKYTLLIIVTIASMMSCSQLEVDNIEGLEVSELVFSAIIERDSSTKTTLSGDNNDEVRKVLWSPNDSILVVNFQNKYASKFTNILDYSGEEAHFKGSIVTSSSYNYYAFYPYHEDVKYASDKFSFELPRIQHYNGFSFGTTEFPMVGYSDTTGSYSRLFFKNLCGILEINLTGTEKVTSIVFRGVDSTGSVARISGKASVSPLVAGEPIMQLESSANNDIMLDCGEGVQLNELAPTPFYVVLPPGKYNSFSVIINTEDGKTMFKRTTNPLTIARSMITKANSLEYEKSKIVDLSISGTANSYIVSEAGIYEFDASVIGNGIEGIVNSTWFHTNDPNISPSSADLIWQDITLPISNVSYNPQTKKISFIHSGMEGNALIAAKDDNGAILWSWHIWCTDNPEECQYVNNAGIMMDRNLGAVSSVIGQPESLGLLYQWGRKDPFIGSISLENSNKKSTTINWPSAQSSSEDNISFSIKNPILFIKGNSYNGDWLYSGSSTSDSTRWGNNKTIYDPCPNGWRVPKGWDGGVWDLAGFLTVQYNIVEKGLTMPSYLSGKETWYPAQGYMKYSNGLLYEVGTDGYYWTTMNVASEYTNYLLHFGFQSLTAKTKLNKASGLSVRCQKDVVQEKPKAKITIDSLLYATADSACVKVSVSGFDSLALKGVVWDLVPNPTIDSNLGILENKDSTSTFISKIALDRGETYYMRAFAKEYEEVKYSNEISFVTSDKVNPMDLSKNGTANSYIVYKPGSYKFKCDVRGNNKHSTISNISGVAVIWETVNTLSPVNSSSILNNVRLNGNYIEFEVPEKIKSGNVLLAVRNNIGVIEWSWHIWVTEYNPNTEYNTYSSGIIMMDRNLGALSNVKGSVEQRGLVYQWGRKDPFTGSGDIDNQTLAVTYPETAIKEITSTSSTGLLSYIQANPSHILMNGVENDWLYSFRNDTLWSSNKSQFDPCPPGWRVPDAIGTWDGFREGVDETSYYVFYQPSTSPLTVYPMVPYMFNNRVPDNSKTGRYWTCTPGESVSRYFDVAKNNALDSCGRVYQMPVRCAKDQKFKIERVRVDTIKNTSAVVKFSVVYNEGADVSLSKVGALVSDTRKECYSRELASIYKADICDDGEYDLVLTGLEPNTLYYFIVYAEDKTGAKYSRVISFKTTLEGENEGLGNENYEW